MNFVGKFDASQPDGLTAHSHVHVEHPSTHAPADAIIVPDAHLLFGADFKRAGVDLILSNADRELVVHDYFKGEHRHPLASPDGAHLTGDIVNALTGQVEVAQAGAPDAVAHVIGHVTKLIGSATAIRNGVSVILNNGDNVEKGDVVATGSDSTLGVTFIDGTVFGLSSNARMVLNEMVYDPNGSNNSSLISLVAGTISFVAGETAKHGDMKVDTPVATMGIRGTAVLVEIDFNVPNQNGLPDAKFQVLVEPDGTTGSYILFDKTTLDPIATVNRAGQQVNINQNGISYTNSPLTPELQKLITDVFTQKFSNTDTNTKLVEHFTDSIVPQPFQTFKGPDIITVQAVFLPNNTLGNAPSQNQGPGTSHPHIDVAPDVFATNGISGELLGITGSHTPDVGGGVIRFADLNEGDAPTASAAFNSFVFQNAQKQDISHSLTPTELAAVQAVEVALDVVQDPAGINHGVATWTYSVPDGALDFLGAGETLTLTYLATVTNNFAQSIKTTTVPITITITGTNDVPVITSAVPQTIAFLGGTNVAGGDLTAHVPTSGTITFDDPDLTDTHTVSVSNPTSTLTDPTTNTTTAFTLPPTPLAIFDQALTASITDGTTHLPTDSTGTGLGSVSWSLADLPVWLGDFIPDGEILTLTYVVTVTDSQGATAKQDITVTITGTASPAVVWIATTGTGPAPDGLWSTAHNWETGNAPTSSDDAIIITDQLEGLTPTYPVTITSAVGVNGAAANSLTMDNFGGSAPVLINQVALAIGNDFDINDHSTGNPEGYTGPEFDNESTGTVTIGGAFNLGNDSIVHNAGSITVTGKMEALDQGTVQNSGTIKLAGGGDFGGQSTISNTTAGALIEVSGGTLNVDVDISNLGTVKIDPSAALTLASAAIDGGTVTNNGTLTLNGDAVVKNGTLGNSSQIDVSGAGNALDNEQVTNTGGIEIVALGALTLDLLTTVTNTSHTITVDGTGTLTLQGGASITNGNISNSGTVDIEGAGATLDGVTVTGTGAINVDAPVPVTLTTLVLKDTTSFTDGTLTVGPNGILSNAGSVTLDHIGVTNQNSIEVTAGNALTLDDATTVDNGSGTVTIDGTATLTLNDASIDGGTINDFTTDPSGSIIAGDIDVTGSSTISNAHLNNGNVTLSGNVKLTLDGSTAIGTSFDDTASGAVIQLDGGDTLTLSGVKINGGAIDAFTAGPSGSIIAGDIDVTGSSTISNAHLNNGNVTLSGNVKLTLDGSTVTGTSFDDTASGAVIQLDGGDTLTLSGATINGGTINAFTSIPSGNIVAGDIDVTGASTISNAHLNNGNVTVGGNVTLTLTSDTVAGTNFTDTAGGATIQVVGNTILDDVTISGGTVTNSFNNAGTTITIDGGQTLKLQDGVTVSGGTLNNAGTLDIESSTGATLNGVTIIGGGAIQVDPAVQVTATPLVLEGGTSITGGTLTVGATSGSLAVKTAAGATLDHVGVTNDRFIEVFAGSNLTLDDGTTVADGTGTLTIDGGATLTLNDASLNGGTINDFTTGPSGSIVAGDIDVTGSSTISNAHLNHGNVTLGSNVTLNLDGSTVTGTSFDDTASGAVIQVDGGDTLTLNDVSINGGTVNDFTAGPSGSIVAGDIDVTGSSTISNVSLNHGHVTLGGNVTLNLDGTTVNGASFDDTASGATIQVDGNDTLTLSGVTINGGTINDFTAPPSGSIVAGDIDVTGSSTISNAHLNNGNVTIGGNVTLTLDGSTVTGTSFNDTASGATIQVDGGDTLTLSNVSIDGGAIDAFTSGPSGSIVAGDIDVTGSSTISNTHLNNGNVTLGSNVTLTLSSDTVAGADFIDTATGATIQIVGNTVLDDVTISGGTVTNSFNNAGTTITIDGGQTLKLQDGVTVSGGTLSNSGTLDIESVAGATLNGVTITGGGDIEVDGVVQASTTPLVLEGGTSITGGTLTVGASSGYLVVEGASGATLDHVGVTNDKTIDVLVGSSLTLDDGTTVANGSGTLTVDGGATLTLNDAEITGGTLNDFSIGGSGTIDVTGSSKIDGGATLNHGNVTLSSNVTLTLDNVTVNGTSFDDTASGAVIQVDGNDTLTLNDVSINGGTINDFTAGPSGSIVAGDIDVTGSSTISNAHLNNGYVTLGGNVTLNLDGTAVNGASFDDTASGAVIQIDGGDTLTLNGVSINGGTINDFTTGPSGSVIAGDIDVTGSSTISNAHLNHGNVTLGSNVTLNLDGSTVTGTSFDDTASGAVIQVDGGDTLTLNDVSISGGTINDFTAGPSGSIVAGDIDVTGSSTISNVSLNHGHVTLGGNVTLNLDGSTVTGTSFDDTASGTVIQVDGNDTLTLSGATINGGTINAFTSVPSGGVIAGDIDVTGSSTISDAVLNNGQVTIDANQTLTLDNVTVTGASFDDTAGGATIQIDGGDTLTLNGVSIDAGTINAFTSVPSGSVIAADIDVTGSSGISNAQLNHGHVTIESNVHLGFDNGTVSGTSFDDTASGATIDTAGTVTLDDVSINGGTVHNFSTLPGGQTVANTIDINGDSTISNAALNGGNVTLGDNAMLTLDGSTVTGTSFDDTASGAVIQVHGAVGDTVALSGVNITGGGLNVAAHGLVQTSGDVTLTNTSVINDGTIEVTGGKLAITGTGSVADGVANDGGTIQIDGGAVLDLNVSDTQNVSFSGTGGELQIDTGSFGGNIVGLAATDQIDLSTIGYGLGTTATYVSDTGDVGGTLTITDGQHSISLHLVGDYSNAHFAGSADGNGTLITLNADDDAPGFAQGENAQIATVAELANVTSSPTQDDSSPASGAIHFTDIDLTDRPTATFTQTVTWTGSAALTGGEQSALEGAFHLPSITNTNNGEIDWTYSITDSSLDFLGAGETATVTSTITLNDHQGGHDTATVTVTVSGANDVPTITATGGGLTELPNVTGNGATDTATGTITFTDADVTDQPTVSTSFVSFDYKDAAGDELTLTSAQQAAIEEASLALLSNGTPTNTGSFAWTYSVADSALDFMAAGDKLVLTYNATVDDGHVGGTASTPITVTINGSDDLPSISGTTSGAVADAGVSVASGLLSAADPDRGDRVTWSVVGGTSVAAENYGYGLEDLKVVKGGNTIFHDTFTGTAPPTGPNFAGDTNGTNPVYTVSGGTFVAGATAAQIEGADAAPVGISLSPSTYGDVVFGQYTTLLSGTSFNAAPGAGLRSGESFTASAVFDLVNPTDSTTHYGMRLSDRVSGSSGGTNDQPGTETVDLHVVHNADGSMSVQLNEIDFETGTSTNLQTIQIATGLTQGITDNAIQLDLSNATATNGHVTASFQLFGINSGGTEVADGGPVVFTTTGQIFDNEDWTRVQVYGQSTGTSDTAPADVTANAVSVLQGTYGTLDVNEQTGTWQYFLNPGLASVKALAAGQTAIDTFSIQATDTAGQHTTQAVNVTVTGIDDAPTVGIASPGPVSTDENHAVTINGITVNDVDAGSSQIEVTLAAGHGALSLANAAGLDSVITNNDGSINLFGSQAAIDTALSHGVIYTPVTDYSGADTLTVTANDQVGAALGGPLTGTGQISINVEPGTPTFSSMTLTIAQGGTDVLTDANFSISDPDTSHFLYSVNNVTGGQFEVFNGTNWVSAPTGGFTTQQIEAGRVEFVQDGTDTTPGFSITAADGTNVSAAINPTVTFTPTPPAAHDDVLSGPSGGGWVLDTDNGHYYREVTTLGSFETAVANAAADGGYLATITSAAEQSFVVNHVIDGFSATWLGGETNNDRPDGNSVNESVWSWVSGPEAGTQFSYTNWNPGEPSGGFNATTQWLQIGATGGWNDAPDAGQLGDGLGAGYLEEWGGTPTQITFLENTGTAIATSVLLANDTDVNGLPLTVTAVGDSNGHSQHGGTVSLNGDVITYTPSTGYTGADSFAYTITDGNGTSTATVSFDVAADVAPVLDSMTLTVAQGGTEVLSDANFSVTDPDSASFVFTANNVTSGQFEVFDGTHWAQASDFTTAQIEAGHVEFVQDGTATAPDFSISVSDGISASAAIAPTVDFIQPHALAPANLIVNGGFETYDYTGWTISGVATPDSVVVGPYHEDFSNDVPHTGSHEALVGSQPEEMTLSQTVATTDGAHYTVDFWAMQDQPPIIGDDFSASWNGTTLTSLVDVGQQSGYTEYQFDVTGAAGSASSTLTFSANNEGYWDIDDVSVLKGAPTTVQEMSDTTTAVTGVNATDTLTVTPPQNALGTVSASAGNGTVEWQFQATNAQLDHLMGLTQSFTVTDTTNPSATQTVAVSVGGNGNDQFVFHAGVGADTMVNFSMLTTGQGAYAGDTIELANFTGIASPSDVLAHLSADNHGNAVVDLGNHDSITFQGLSVAQIQANASHIFHV